MPEATATIATKLRRFLSELRYTPRALLLVWHAARGWTLAALALVVVQGLLPIATVHLVRLAVDHLAAVVKTGVSGVGFWWPLVALAGVLLAKEALGFIGSSVRAVQTDLLSDHVRDLVHQQCGRLDMAFYEWPEYFDQLHRAKADAGYRPIALLESYGSLLQHGITLVAMAAILIPYGIWVPLVLLVGAFPALGVVLRYSRRQHDWYREHTELERRCSYYDWLLTSDETAAELRLLDLGPHYREVFRAARRSLRKGKFRLAWQQGAATFVAALAALVVTGAVLAWMVLRVLQGRATLGDLAFFYQAFSQGQRGMHTLFQQVGQIYSNSLFLGNLFAFLEQEPQVVDPRPPAIFPAGSGEGLRLSNVTFGYPGRPRPALDNFSLHIPQGQCVALVGPNGAGKTTLLKLLCRFYDPDQGVVAFNGVDLRSLALCQWWETISVLLQEPVHYSATVAENIGLGCLARSGSLDAVEAAARAAGAAEWIADLPGGYQQQLRKWFQGGTELSVGQWQRLAMARAFFRPAEVFLFDEPTSAMDPWAEIAWLRRLRERTAGKTAIVITHRLTTAMHADVIHVLAEGRLVESGSHAQLLQRGGLYAQSWQDQRGCSDSGHG